MKTLKDRFDGNGAENTGLDEIIYIGFEVAAENRVSLAVFQRDSQPQMTLQSSNV